MRTIIITGANGGLGTAMARAFLSESQENRVWLGIHHNRAHADALAGEAGPRCRIISLDVTSSEEWRLAVETVLKTDGRVDVLVNNAGGHADGLLAMMPLVHWETVMATSLDGAFHGCQAVLPSFVSQRSGRIINIASVSGLLSPPGQANYAAAKAGLIAMTSSLAKEVARLNITVNAICPGFIETDALAQFDTNPRATALARVPMRRFGRPDEVASAVLFLASREASYITGAVLKIDGGIL